MNEHKLTFVEKRMLQAIRANLKITPELLSLECNVPLKFATEFMEHNRRAISDGLLYSEMR